MRVRNYCSKSVSKLFCLSVLAFLCACSNVTSDTSKASKDYLVSGVSKVSQKSNANDKDNQHTHPSNPCSSALAHSHVYAVKEHEHKYNCESTTEIISNAHIHPVTNKSRKFRHVHPNGASKHKHHKE